MIKAAERALAAEPNWDDDEDLKWKVWEAVVLFDSAIPGAELEPGQYRVRATCTKDEDNWMILVQLQSATSALTCSAPVPSLGSCGQES
ncbi:hypothetical protein [Nonomuraea dietziae]|uniref:hypothetical protein n=1 Tax=Nonomuraea dietziae TaxID=65515 RepID=UPI003F4CD0D2